MEKKGVCYHNDNRVNKLTFKKMMKWKNTRINTTNILKNLHLRN